jgi:hypothetical protein
LKFPKERDPNEDQYGLKIGYFVKKSKVCVPHRTGEFEVYTREFDGHRPGEFSLSEYLSFLVNAGIVEKSGSWYTVPDVGRVQGSRAVIDWLEEKPAEEREEIRERCLAAWAETT